MSYTELKYKTMNLCKNKPDVDTENMTLQKLISMVSQHRFILVSGKAGTGKSFLLNQLKTYLSKSGHNVVVTAPTAVAAMNVNGITLHSWLGMGLANDPIEKLIKCITYRTKSSILSTGVLLIDEISMVDSFFFEKVSQICCYVHNVLQPFGNLKIVMFGDFLQLPPISHIDNNRFVFQTQLWPTMNVQRLRLLKIYRQSDNYFVNMLNQIRVGELSQCTLTSLQERCRTPPSNTPITKICNFRKYVDRWNDEKLNDLPGDIIVYNADYVISKLHSLTNISQHDRHIAKSIISQNKFIVPSRLKLKIGAQVMLRCNTMISQNLYNGSVGIITKLNTHDINVNFMGKYLSIKPHCFNINVGTTCCLQYIQFPLCLSWAMTVHKCQSLTLDNVLVDTDCFEEGQMYTAISRVKTLNNLYFTSWDITGLKINQDAKVFET